MTNPVNINDITSILNGSYKEPEKKEKEEDKDIDEQDEQNGQDGQDDEGKDLSNTDNDVEEEQKPKERHTAKSLAEKLGVDVKELYDLVDIALPNDKSYTLSQIKDLASEGVKYGKVKSSLEKDSTELMIGRRELALVADNMIKSGRISQQDVDAINALESKRLQKEMSNFLKAVPTWDDIVVRNSEITKISKFVGMYGLNVNEFESLVTDSRLMKLVRDAAINLVVDKPVEKKVIPRKTVNTSASKVQHGKSKQDKLSAISQLLK